MKKIGFVTNLDKDADMGYTRQLADWVRENGCMPLVAEGKGRVPRDCSVAGEYMYRNADFVVVLGGDGTILRAARKAALFNVPILGINIGTLGYLADCERSSAKEAIKNTIEGRFKIEKRMMLEAVAEDGGTGRNIALNEAYVTGSAPSEIIELRLEINGDYISSCRADGIIISTPTGSTAYNLSAGGPILKPDTELMAITHVCPHSLTSRPFVVSDCDTVKIRVENPCDSAVINMDGQQGIPLRGGASVIIRKSQYVTQTIRTTQMSFYDILRKKMFK